MAAKKKKKKPNSEFSFRENSHVTKIWKTTFLKEFSNKVVEHKYIYIVYNTNFKKFTFTNG